MMSNQTLLVELLTEELPPKALARLGEAFCAAIVKGLVERQLVAAEPTFHGFASPRRLAITIDGVSARAPERSVSEKIMPVKVALDAAGNPSPALLKKLEAKAIPLDAIARFEKRMDGKTETFFYEMTVAGAVLDAVLADIVADAIRKLPIPKLMRWGDSDHEFVRPVHGLVMLHGSRVVPGTVLGLESRGSTLGHRFMGQGEIEIGDAQKYAITLYERGNVIASFAARRAAIGEYLKRVAAEVGEGAHPIDDEALLDEVTALVEHPTVYAASFEPEFLSVPQECLILTMKQNQKYFPLLDAQGKLLNTFLLVSNMKVDDPTHIVAGNARVVRARLSDAKFFFDQDRKTTLESRVARLGSVVYHNKLGTQLQRVERLEQLAAAIARRLGANVDQARSAARLAKADLVTDMVGEFPELQGVMGQYYARHDGESEVVAAAIEAHYRPRFAGDELPQGAVACAVALADKLDALVGFFGIGQTPTGDKDPFGLRRAALGLLRIVIETPLPLDLVDLIDDASSAFAPGLLKSDYKPALLDFMLERLRNLLREAGHAAANVDAVLAQLSEASIRIDLVPAKLAAVSEFSKLPEAAALAAANKRVLNIIRKNRDEIGAAADAAPSAELMSEPAERELLQAISEVGPRAEQAYASGRYAESLTALATLKPTVDAFFDQVMVMAEDRAVRANRVALLQELGTLMNRVADISRLAA